MLLVTAVLIALGAAVRAGPSRVGNASSGILAPAAITVLWGWLLPEEPLLMAAGLAATTVYLALTAPRPYAEIGLGLLAVTYIVSQFAFGARGDLAWQVIGVGGTDLALGVLLLSIRLTTEQRVEERTQALAAANVCLEQLNRTDPLTGLANRRQLDAALADAWADAMDSGGPVSVIMIDIDHFKLYNDHYGHLGGDSCLQKVAAAVAQATRSTDIAARYGGEEFSIILPGTDLAAARRAAERVRLNVACLLEEHVSSPNGFITISVGVASAGPSDRGTAKDLVEQADRNLYDAKRGGRNRVSRSEPESVGAPTAPRADAARCADEPSPA